MSDWERAATLPVRFFERDAAEVGRHLLGAVISTRFGGQTASGRIVEVEAYLGAADPASHAFRFRRHRQNEAIYGAPGSWYVYRSYGMHWCANLVTAPEGFGSAVLIRALEPLEGLEVMRARRGGVAEALLCAGPGRLCEALGIDRRLDGVEMATSEARVRPDRRISEGRIQATPRIGITQARHRALRFCVLESPWLSRPPAKQRGSA
jgi:DNA-3-methyladenine glycosylase